MLALLAAWGTCSNPSNCPEDLDGDGNVGVSDLLIMLAEWGPCDTGCDNCVEQSVVDPCVQDCLDRYEPGTRNFEACIEWCRDGGFGEFVPPEPEE